jgi:hypothetical protein
MVLITIDKNGYETLREVDICEIHNEYVECGNIIDEYTIEMTPYYYKEYSSIKLNVNGLMKKIYTRRAKWFSNILQK